jgi:GMP synthase (glutamine-hydrolysing)
MTKFLLLQARNADDPMLTQEVSCFAKALQCGESQIDTFDLISGCPSIDHFRPYDIVLLGGSGDYSVAEGGDWLPPALEAMRELYDLSKPTFASCWGFQAMAKALGGEVVTDMSRAELGTVEVFLTEEGKKDSLFGPLGDHFLAPMGHQDCVTRLPDDAILLASSEKVENQAFKIKDKPIYCTQFHPELDREALIERVTTYPQYVLSISGSSLREFTKSIRQTDECYRLLNRMSGSVCGTLKT